ncbi:myosin-9-like [Nilaparvata lugens]|uniref:myosin-9-like n=1 Tax=Nilaparvata lugens TaxID=108931 RepID=UPI00193CD949|nr:myosin-9-like [Nilaparvata lugens]
MEFCCDKCKCASEVENLQRLLKTVNAEKDLAIDMYKVSSQTIETLEEELETREGGKEFELFKRRIKEAQYQMQSDYTEAINILEEKLRTVAAELRSKIDENKKKSLQIAELNAKLDVYRELKIEYESVCERETEFKEKCLILETKCLELEKKLELVRPTQDELERQVHSLTDRWRTSERQLSELQLALERATDLANQLSAKEMAARQKVAEAVTLVESTLVDKQTVDYQKAMLENECRRLKKELMELIDEAGKQVSQEADLNKKDYESRLQMITSQMELIEKVGNSGLFYIAYTYKII